MKLTKFQHPIRAMYDSEGAQYSLRNGDIEALWDYARACYLTASSYRAAIGMYLDGVITKDQLDKIYRSGTENFSRGDVQEVNFSGSQVSFEFRGGETIP